MRKTVFVMILAALLTVALANVAAAQNSRTVFSIGDISGDPTYPLRAYAVNGNTLVLSATWRPLERDGGPVGIGVDPIHERMFISYEFSGKLDVFDATDATPLGQITLVSPDPLNPVDDLCGLDVHEGRGLLFAVDRFVKLVYVFDSDTFDHVETWTLPTGEGGVDIEVLEDVNGQDLIFVTDGTKTVRWYDIDTHAEVGSATQQYVAAGIGVYIKTGGYPVLFTGSPSAHDFPHLINLLKKDTQNGAETKVYLGGGSARGIAVDQPNARVYASVGPFALGMPSARVFSVQPFVELFKTNFGGITHSPTDLDATWLAFGSDVKKTSTSHPDGNVGVGEEVVFEITITNKSTRPISKMPLKDVYNTAHLTYLYADAPYTSNNNVDDGVIDWTNLIAQRGSNLPNGDSITVTVHFQAQPEACQNFVEGENLAEMSGALTDQGQPVDDAAGTFAYKIICGCLVDADCEDDLYCNGTEFCNDDNLCESTGNPCPIDDGDWCNGEETDQCFESVDECGHTGSPCEDDGWFCTGETICDGELEECRETGNPCDEGEECNEQSDTCESVDEPDPEPDPDDPEFDDEDEPLPTAEEEDPGKGEVTGGCCGCG
ncbi:MAG: hypothetical protein M5R36_07275 [Deltaproteobacteria bacterium]|nr:hypothetical protein [Deltaproteobacteria bacterium]